MKIAPVADVKARFSSYLEQCADSPVIITKNGRPVAVLLAVSDEEELERLVLAHTPKFKALLDSAYDRIQRGEGVTHDQFWEGSATASSPQPTPPPRSRPRSVRTRALPRSTA
jgi:prevent-host-death family protein